MVYGNRHLNMARLLSFLQKNVEEAVQGWYGSFLVIGDPICHLWLLTSRRLHVLRYLPEKSSLKSNST